MGGTVHSTGVVLEAQRTQADVRALHRWAASPLPRRLSMAGLCLLVAWASVAAIVQAPILVYVVWLFIPWLLVRGVEATVAAEAARRSTVEVDQHGVRFRATTVLEVPWESIDRVELTD